MDMLKVVVVGNCQVRPIADILQKMNEAIEISGVAIVHLLSSDEEEGYNEIFAESDYIITQQIDDSYPQTFVRTSKLKKENPNKVIVILNLYCKIYDPDWFYYRSDDRRTLSGPIGEYHNHTIFDSWKDGLLPGEALLRLSSIDYNFRKYGCVAANSLIELKDREKQVDVGITDFIQEKGMKRRLFHTFNHPAYFFLEEYVSRILKYIGIVVDYNQAGSIFEPLGRFSPEINVLLRDEEVFQKNNPNKGVVEPYFISPNIKNTLYSNLEVIKAFYSLYNLKLLKGGQYSNTLVRNIVIYDDQAIKISESFHINRFGGLFNVIEFGCKQAYEFIFYNFGSDYAKSFREILSPADRSKIFRLIYCFVNGGGAFSATDEVKSLEDFIDMYLLSNNYTFNNFECCDFESFSCLRGDGDVLDEIECFYNGMKEKTTGSIVRSINNNSLRMGAELDEKDHYIFRKLSRERKSHKIIDLKGCVVSFDFTKNYQAEYYIFNSDDEYLKDYSFGGKPFRNNPLYTENKSIAFIDDKFTKFNVCHFLLDKIPRVFEFNEGSVDEFLIFQSNSYVQEVVKALGVKLFELSNLPKRFTIQFDRLQLTTSSSKTFVHPGQNIYSHTEFVLDKLIDVYKDLNVHPKKIFIDRSGESRDVVNYQNVKKLLTEKGFEYYNLSDLSLAEQICLFNSAECVVGIHGAGLTNIGFCKPGTKVVEVFSPLCGTIAFYKLASSRCLDYRYIIGEDEFLKDIDYDNWSHQPALYNRNNVIIPVEKLKEALQ